MELAVPVGDMADVDVDVDLAPEEEVRLIYMNTSNSEEFQKQNQGKSPG